MIVNSLIVEMHSCLYVGFYLRASCLPWPWRCRRTCAAQAGTPLVRTITQFIERRSDCGRHRQSSKSCVVRRRQAPTARSRSRTCRRARITCRCARRATRRAAPRCRSAAGRQRRSTCSSIPSCTSRKCCRSSPDARSQFESFQPTSVLAGQELSKQLEMSLGATLESQPGVASRSFGPAPARPVVRGLDGDRVLILQDGQRMGDLSSQSGDHGVPINPAAAQRIEVVRGPATLLYGANAIGGLVNVITDEIPTKPHDGRERQLHVRSRQRRRRRRRPPATCTSATARSRCTPAAAAAARATWRHRKATSPTRSRGAASATSACRGPARRATSAAATATTTRNTAFPSSKRARCS